MLTVHHSFYAVYMDRQVISLIFWGVFLISFPPLDAARSAQHLADRVFATRVHMTTSPRVCDRGGQSNVLGSSITSFDSETLISRPFGHGIGKAFSVPGVVTTLLHYPAWAEPTMSPFY